MILDFRNEIKEEHISIRGFKMIYFLNSHCYFGYHQFIDYPDSQMSLKLLSYCQQSLKQSILKN